MSPQLHPAEHAWMTADETITVIGALQAGDGEARFVGGAVRNALLGQKVADIDIATTLTPDAAVSALKQAGIEVVPTGIEHGTVTAIVNSHPFEVTSLRRDVSTDGRRATVAFTHDWAEDAARRDFTMNAIYADTEGNLFDPTGGVDDLHAGHVKFVGDANARIREDYLRILRFFRFHAWYGKAKPDETALKASASNREGLKRLSGERVQKELLRLLEAPDPGPAVLAMQTYEIIDEILPTPANVQRLVGAIAIAQRQNIPRGPIVSLAALLSSSDAARAIASNLRFSNANRAHLAEILSACSKLTSACSPSEITTLLYRFGRERFCEMLLLAWAENPIDSAWEGILERVNGWSRPEFPIDGRDVMKAGSAEGPNVGQILSELESWWLEHNFTANRERLLAKLKELIG